MDHLSLFELNRIVRDTLDRHLEPAYWVVAEIGELREAQNGHCYLELVEKSEDKVIAKLRANIWAYAYRSISAWFRSVTGDNLRPGISILCQVQVQYHELYGLSANIKEIDAKYTLGERARRRQEIIEKLKSDGVFDMNKMISLPLVPQRIAVITSPTAAGYGDFTDQIINNPYQYTFRTTLFKATMQGEGAAESMIQCLLRIHEQLDKFDAVIIIRGGGSQLDLDCFDHYELASHVAQFPLPVITGIGHERDETILDMIAHSRMKTPTAVAEFLISGLRHFEERMISSYTSITRHARNKLTLESQKLQTSLYQLNTSASRRVSQAQKDIDRKSGQIVSHCRNTLRRENEILTLAGKSLSLLDPRTILKRGYTITRVAGTSVSLRMPEAGQEMETISIHGVLTSTIIKINKNDDREDTV